ncbi:MAG: hypothetical protein K2G31_05655, partial [Clostridia bacterium]|nr:hypothetical protein [Clostridia bacterium]
IMAPPPVFEHKGKAPFGIDNELIKNDLHSAAGEIKRGMLLSEYIDLYAQFDGKPELFSDGAHPTKEGAALIAEMVSYAIEKAYSKEVFSENGEMHWIKDPRY